MMKHIETNRNIDYLTNRTLTSEQAAEFLGVTPRTLVNWRYKGRGPKFIRTGAVHSRVLYRLRDLNAWLDDLESAAA